MEKIKLLLYCNRQKPYLVRIGNNPRHLLNLDKNPYAIHPDTKVLNGKIVAECDFEVEEIKWLGQWYDKDVRKESCLSGLELYKYLEEKGGYAIHIKNLNIFDKPRNLSNYEDEWENPLEKAPQNMRRCYSTLYCNIEADMPIRTDSYILISIHPEWLCKILNGEKTIELRKKILKEMV